MPVLVSRAPSWGLRAYLREYSGFSNFLCSKQCHFVGGQVAGHFEVVQQCESSDTTIAYGELGELWLWIE